MKIPLVVAVKHGVIVSLTVRWNVEFLVPYETVYRNLGTRRKDIKVRFTSRNTFPTSISKNQKKSNLFMIVIMIVIIFHPFDLTMKSLLSVQPVVDGQKFGVFRLGGDPTNDILRNSGRQAFPTKEIYQIHVLLRTFQHQRSLAGIYTTIYKDKKSFLAESSFSISSNEFIIFSPCPASRRCSWKRARK